MRYGVLRDSVAYLEWLGGYLEVMEKKGVLWFRGSNFELGVDQRELIVRGPFEGVREYTADRRGERKIVYIDLAFPIRGFRPRDSLRGGIIRGARDFSMGSFGLSYTRLENIGSYITVYPPPGFMYEQVVVSQHKIAVFTIGRRRVYLMEDDGVKRLIMV